MKKFLFALMAVLFLGSTAMVFADGTAAPAPAKKTHKVGKHKGAKKGKKEAAPAPAAAPADKK